MSPLRIVVLLFLFYIVYRLLFKGKKGLKGKPSPSPFGSSTLPAQDVLVEDPFCHTFVPKRNAIMLKQGVETLYFCSEKCYEAYLSQKGASK